MERLISPIEDGGAPYLNQDFYQYLQQNHLTSYSSFLEEINDRTTGNCGIILKGFSQSAGGSITYITDPKSGQSIPILSGISYDLRNSLVYIDGDFLEPAPWLATQSLFDGGPSFIIQKVSLDKIRRYTKVYDFLTDVIEQNYYDIVNSPTNQKFIYFRSFPKYLEIGGDDEFINLTHYNFLKQQYSQGNRIARSGQYMSSVTNTTNYVDTPTTRWLDRILRYYLADEEEIYMTYDLRFFDVNGVGFGEMFGFKLISYNLSGRDYSDLIGRYTIGFSTSSNSTITNLTTDTTIDEKFKYLQKNYSNTGNIGGLTAVTLVTENTPSHTHGTQNGNTSEPDNDMSHTHWVPTDIVFTRSFDSNNSTTPTDWNLIRFGKGVRISKQGQPRFDITNTPYNISPYNQHVAGNGNYGFKLIPPWDSSTKDDLFPYTQLFGIDPNTGRGTEIETNIQDHTHTLMSSISSDLIGSSVESHQNIPPTTNIAYYVKYDPYNDPATPPIYQ